jgi:DNA-binding transcriptional MerR regulator
MKKRYSIEDLAELTGFTRRTIRYYIQEGLLEPPAGRGRGGFYFDSHLDQLRQIRSLQGRGLRLKAIAEVMSGRDMPRLAAQALPEAAAPAERELWVRYSVAPGIEIQVARQLEETGQQQVAEIVRVARSILTKGGD